MRVSEWMSTDLVVVRAGDPLEAAIVQMDRHAVRHVLVFDHDRCVGVLSDRDLLEATGWSTLRARHANPDAQIVRDLMSASLETVVADDALSDACRRMFERHIGCLPVVDARGATIGMLTERDAIRAFQHAQRKDAQSALLDPPLSHVMSRDMVALDVATPVREAFARARADGVRHLCVAYDGWFVGLVSDRDLRLCVGRGEADRKKLGDIMVKDVVSLPPSAKLSQAVDTLAMYRFSAIPVLEARKLEGLVTTSNVLARLARYLESSGEVDAADAARA
jgi:CBS domain-containing protein